MFNLLSQIVWDPDKNRWVNLNADEDNAVSAIPPPPKASDLAPDNIPIVSSAATAPNANSSYFPNPVRGNENVDQADGSSTTPLPSSGPNKYKMTRGKSKRMLNFFHVRIRVKSFL